jgi:hypothetical protein
MAEEARAEDAHPGRWLAVNRERPEEAQRIAVPNRAHPLGEHPLDLLRIGRIQRRDPQLP